ncbi:hypothetical protein [Serratia marcescens]|uniref:hypothetical protein n=1 Tax=Serratia marcescens TaxID=615 RepID=UPI000F7D814C|nr:hypothetical protein [Serratia marcescens]RTF55395.1 hypothetical protein D9B79_14500 [Serratia marcescens]RTF68931.1 hypothetical protein D9B73_26970 [Serratia marcescens]RTF76468.1 hypothetical protein D9B75_06595 [Serratia marcescens]RTF86444.1 hypothetical protein D9B72_26805 [Serratia marcescens]RTF86998.1 hypothetical protein D9B70_25940 [Serratia marcescens]
MASKKQQGNELGGLPPELMVGEHENGEELKVDGQEPDNSADTDTDTDTDIDDDDDSDDDQDGEQLPAGMVSVVVTKGNTVRHDGCDYPENRAFMLPVADAQRLIGLGVVADVEQLRKLALLRSAPAVSVQSGE